VARKPRAPLSAKARAVDLLSRREHGRAELFWKLVKKQVPRGEVEAALDSLEELGLLDDHRAATGLTRYYVELRSYGPNKLRQVLRRERSFPDYVVAQVFEELDVDWRAKCTALAERRGLRGPERKDRDKLVRFLIGRGFAPGMCFEVVRELERTLKEGEE
jgi:regulatory protein